VLDTADKVNRRFLIATKVDNLTVVN